MTIKLIAKYCSMAVLVLIVISTFGPADWPLGWLLAVGGVLVAALLAELLILALRRAGPVHAPQESNDDQAGGHDTPS